jgi:uncharacterized protein (TIGR03435 family)
MLAASGPFVWAQGPVATDTSLKFDVASLKPSPPGGIVSGTRVDPGGQTYRATNVAIEYLMTVAWRVKTSQIVGGPAWVTSDRYDIIAKAQRPSSVEELHTMLKNLLTERLQLKFHIETKQTPVYVLTVDKGGTKLTPHEAQNAGDPWIETASDQPLHIKMKATSAPMDFLAFRLAERLDRPVIDQTGLKGGYDFNLAYTMEAPTTMHEGMVGHNGKPIDFSGPTIFEALRQQLGLQLEARKGPAETIVIDRLEKPSEN